MKNISYNNDEWNDNINNDNDNDKYISKSSNEIKEGFEPPLYKIAKVDDPNKSLPEYKIKKLPNWNNPSINANTNKNITTTTTTPSSSENTFTSESRQRFKGRTMYMKNQTPPANNNTNNNNNINKDNKDNDFIPFDSYNSDRNQQKYRQSFRDPQNKPERYISDKEFNYSNANDYYASNMDKFAKRNNRTNSTSDQHEPNGSIPYENIIDDNETSSRNKPNDNDDHYNRPKNNFKHHALNLETQKYPIYSYKEAILEAIEKNQVVIVSGNTGCGKSTQVPKYLHEYYKSKGKPCKILCTQPRRIAAINLARRVRSELKALYGEDNFDVKTVGFQIGMESDFNQTTDILYVTNGIFLQRFIHEDTFDQESIMYKFTHVILDEIHERDIDSDFIMLAIKHVLPKNKDFRLILMSATIKAEMFAKYFSKEEIERCSSFEFNYDSNRVKKYAEWNSINSKLSWNDELSNHDSKKELMNNHNLSIKKKNDNSSKGNYDDDYWGSSNNDDTWDKPKKSNNVIDLNNDKEEYMQEKGMRNSNGGSQKGLETPAKIINIDDNSKPAKNIIKHVVLEYYLDELHKWFDINTGISSNEFSKKRAFLNFECIEITIDLIAYITSNRNKDEAKYRNILGELPSILIFLPGISEIYLTMDKIYEFFKDTHKFDLIPLHSTLSDGNQQEAFKKPAFGHRKIILSTNIAESSITIPDVLYVIDFCLTKELNAAAKKSVESLDLIWASKASCRQRAGRTGRVADGFVFRLVPRDFYLRQMDDFSRPEMHRSPLDKLILRIKMLHESEKANKAKQKNEYLFLNPKLVLGRALEPPDIDQIGQSIKSLKSCGALTAFQDNDDIGDITFLGRVYCDLPCEVKISKLCLLGVAYEVPEEAFTLAGILSQQKSIFIPETKNRSRDKFIFFKQLWLNSDGQNSDHISLLRIYIEWEDLWSKPLISHRNRKFKSTATFEEKDWCSRRYLDPQILRDIYFTKADIKMRLVKLGVKTTSNPIDDTDHHYQLQQQQKQKQKQQDQDQDDNNDISIKKYKIMNKDSKLRNEYYNRIKIVLAGAFYPHYLKKGSWYSDMTLKLADNMKKSLMMDPLRTATLRIPIMNDHMDKEVIDEWKSLLEKFGKIEKIILTQDKLSALYTEEDYDFAIRCLNYIKSYPFDTNRYLHLKGKDKGTYTEEIKFSFQKESNIQNILKSSLNNHELYELSQSGELEYLRRCKFFDFLSNKEIKTEWDSVNSLVLDKLDCNPYTLISHEYQERKSGKIYAKYTTLLDSDNIYLAYIITLLFAPDIQLKPDPDQSRYEGALVDHCELTFNFHLTSGLVNDINEVRSQLAHFFKKENMLKGTNSALWNNTEKLLSRKLIRYTAPEKWQELFLKDNYTKECLGVPRLRTNPLHRKPKPIQNTTDKIDNKSFYLTPIEIPPLLNEPDFDDDNVIKQHTELTNLYKIWKEEKLLQLDIITKMIDMKKTFLICGKCDYKICEYTKIGIEVYSDCFRTLDANTFFIKKIESSAEDEFYRNPNIKWLKQAELKYGHARDYEFWGCFHNHIFCIKAYEYDLTNLKEEDKENFVKIKLEKDFLQKFRIQESYYITSYSNLKLLYPDLSMDVFNFDKYDYKSMVKLTEEKYREREDKLKIIDCTPCEMTFKNIDEFQKHIKDKNHKHNLQEFKSSLIDQDTQDKLYA